MTRSSYSDEEAEAILKLASRRSMGDTVSPERLLATAAELGISPEAVEEAEREIFQNRIELEARAQFDRHRRTVFLNSLAGAVAYSLFLAGIDLYTSGAFSWCGWVILWWGYQLLGSGWSAYGQRGEDYEKAFAKWQLKRGSEIEGSDDEERLGRTFCSRLPARPRIRIGVSRLGE